MKCSTLFKTMPAILLGIVMGVYATPVFAVDGTPPGLFELDGNPADTDDYTLPDDWDALFRICDSEGQCPGGIPFEFTGIIPDPAPTSIFWKGGSKDVEDISAWWHKDGAVPDKDDITNAFAAAYVNPSNICYSSLGYDPECDDSGTETVHFANDQIIYFGFDRFDNSGDAFGGFWFLINDVDLDEARPGRFDNVHVGKTLTSRGDILILVEYPQANDAIPVIKAYEWDPDLLGDPNLDEDGHDIGPLEMIYNSKDLSITALCDGNGDKLACAITNVTEVPTPAWPYTPKGGLEGDPLPHETFYSGGINLTQLLGGENICVSTFLAETRSSRSETAQLKDFVRGGFSLCGSEIITVIEDGDGNEIGYPAFESPPAVMAGTQIHDVATVTITGPGLETDPKGSVDFYLYNGDACSGDPIEGTPVTVALNPGTIGDNVATAKTGLYSLDAAQCYSFHAEFTSTDPDFPGAVLENAACEWVCIAKYPSLITTEIHKDGGHANITFGREPVQTKLHDHAYVKVDGTFPGAPTPTGTVTFKLWKNQVCQPVDVPFSGTFGGVVWPQIVTPLTGGEAWTATFEPSFGFFGILAEYSGDANYDPSVLAVTNCEFLEIYKVDPSILTKVIVRDRAVVTGGLADVPTGNVTINTYRSSDCSGPVENTVILPLPETGPDVGVVTQSTELEQILEVGNNVASYLATYEGDDNYLPRDHGCEVVQFSVQ